MRVAAAIGIGFGDFWHMTPRELETYAGAYAERKKQENHYSYQLAVVTSFLASKWVWAKRVNIDTYLKNDEGPKNKNMSDAQMLNMARILNVQFGGAADGET